MPIIQMTTLHGFLLDWRRVPANDYGHMRFEAQTPDGISFSRDDQPTIFACQAPNPNHVQNWRDVECGDWRAYMGDGMLDFGLDNLPAAIAVCEAKFLEWALPAAFEPTSENHEGVIALMDSLGRMPFSKTL